MASCPHCSETIEKLPGFVPQATLESRLKAKADENKLLTTELTTARTKASGFDALQAERDGLQAKLTGIEQHATRTAAMTEAGLDPALLDHVDILYQSAVSGVDEAPTLAEWLAEDAKAHPLLADKFGKSQAPADESQQVNPLTGKPDLNAAKPNLNPQTPAGQQPQKPGGKITPSDIQSYFASAEYQALPAADKRKKMAEVEAQWNAQENA